MIVNANSSASRTCRTAVQTSVPPLHTNSRCTIHLSLDLQGSCHRRLLRSNNFRCPKLATSTPLFTLITLHKLSTPSLASCTSHLSLALPMCSYDLRCPTLTTTSPADPGLIVSNVRLSTLPAQCTCDEEVNEAIYNCCEFEGARVRLSTLPAQCTCHVEVSSTVKHCRESQYVPAPCLCG